jgi:hypothetical protein
VSRSAATPTASRGENFGFMVDEHSKNRTVTEECCSFEDTRPISYRFSAQ